MSNYNKIIKNVNGITAKELHSLLKHVVLEDEIYVCIDNGKDFPIARKVEMISSQFGCLYITVKDVDGSIKQKSKGILDDLNEGYKPKQNIALLLDAATEVKLNENEGDNN